MSLSTKVKTAVMALVLTVAGVGAALVPREVWAADCTCEQIKTGKTTDCDLNYKVSAKCGMEASGQKETDENGNEVKLDDRVKNVINGVLYVVGILAVVMVIIGGVKYTTSGGDQAQVTSAKNTILYGIVGLVIAILAYAIVNFVIDKIG